MLVPPSRCRAIPPPLDWLLFEWEMIGERTRDRINVARRRGGCPSQRKRSTLEFRKTDERGSVWWRMSGSPVLLGAAQPRKLRVQRRDGLGRSRGPERKDNFGVWLRRGLSLQARPPVAGLSFAAAGADAPQLLGRLIKQEVG